MLALSIACVPRPTKICARSYRCWRGHRSTASWGRPSVFSLGRLRSNGHGVVAAIHFRQLELARVIAQPSIRRIRPRWLELLRVDEPFIGTAALRWCCMLSRSLSAAR